ncbi:hypothetical protein F5887DRAFT_1107092 [Amanita rubescens]|nr:hypothetical protein F5887DRAFT_1107092 [Amanita rubescens]
MVLNIMPTDRRVLCHYHIICIVLIPITLDGKKYSLQRTAVLCDSGIELPCDQRPLFVLSTSL